MKTLLTLLLLVLAFVPARAQAPDSSYAAKMRAPGVQMVSIDGKYKVWTQRVGQGKIKLLVLHGGPGNTHEYFENFPEHLAQEGVELYYYDQLNSYHSDKTPDKDVWRIARFVEEVEQVRQALGLDSFYLLGHSWGGMLALEYASKYPQHIKGLITSNIGYKATVFNKHRYSQYADIIRRHSAKEGKTIAGLDTMGLVALSPYITPAVTKEFRSLHMMRLPQEPPTFTRSQAHITRTYAGHFMPYMLAWDFSERLTSIKLPTLIIGSKHDFVPVADIEYMQRRIPDSQRYICPEGSHYAMWDDPKHYFPALIKFLRKTERKG
ncbi:proline iminopeptidase-family hydrolase [Hymenobacter latericus]|uniref:proline iminopeptidase-family hydrolase n=1 Tax=Hymenobacter sp. YIM 151858-1 TaxID=2987688 RepID=UPI002225BF6A|nr:proline iminopeptidase-family hydrolase [Hymenobacter sp. YIM 151858-1]UYZ57392.1 proline iminopeptidase-family hydrolase [Hymenobacter sp. YIM 151858-1]